MNNIIPNKKRKLSNNLKYPLLYQKKSKISKAMPTKINSIKKNSLENSKDSEALKISYNNIIDNINVNKENIEQIKEKISFTHIVQYAREKIKKEYTSPYIERLVKNKSFNFVKEEEMPIYICFYKINDIFLNKKSRLIINFYENNIYYSEDEYLISYFNKKEYNIILRYILAYIYEKDFYCISRNECYIKTKKIIKRFNDLVNNDYKYINSEEKEKNISDRYKKNDSIQNNFDMFFQNNISRYNLKKKSLLFLSEYEKINIGKIRENYFLKIPHYFFVKDMPKQKIPNSSPRYYSLGYFMYTLTKNYEIKNKFKVYEIKKPEKIKTKPINNINEDSFDNDINKKKGKIKDDDDYTSDLSESSEKFLDEIYLDSSSNESNISRKKMNKKISKRISMIIDKKKKIIEDNDIIDVEKLIENMENKKETKIIEKKRLSATSNIPKKKLHKKTTFKPKLGGYQIIHTDNFQLKQLYGEKDNIVFRYFSKKLSRKFFPKFNEENDKLIILENANNNSSSIAKSILQNIQTNNPNKYFLTSSGLYKNFARKSIIRKNTTKMVSFASPKKFFPKSSKMVTFTSPKKIYPKSSKNVTFRNNIKDDKNNTALPIDKPNNIINKKKYFNSKYQMKNIDYQHNFKNKGKIIKQKKISFSIIHNSNKITFKETKEFFSGIEKTFKNKKHQKEIIKDIITNFGIVHQRRNKSNKFGFITNENLPELSKYRVNTTSNIKNIKKYKISVSQHSSRNSLLLSKNEILRDNININGIFNHKKINLSNI